MMLLSLKEAAAKLRTSEYVLRQAIKRGELDARNRNKASKKPRYTVTEEALAAYDAVCSTKPVQPQPPTGRKRKPPTGSRIQFYKE